MLLLCVMMCYDVFVPRGTWLDVIDLIVDGPLDCAL